MVDIDDVLIDAVDRLPGRRRAAPGGADHRRRRGLPGARAAPRQLGIAVGNLVENAVVYSDPGARVVVAAHRQTRSDDDYVEITVSDNGIGIPPRELERIFERFYRVDYARSRANGGTGLGLSIVKHIAAIHGGDVTVWSQPGQRLHLHHQAPGPPCREPTAQSPSRPTGAGRRPAVTLVPTAAAGD